MTKLIPVYRPETAQYFAENIPPDAYTLDDISFLTAPLKVGVRIGLLGLSGETRLFENGIQDTADFIGPDVTLDALYLQINSGESLIKMDEIGIKFVPLADAQFAGQLTLGAEYPVDGKLSDGTDGEVFKIALTGDLNRVFGEIFLTAQVVGNQTNDLIEVIGFDVSADRLHPGDGPKPGEDNPPQVLDLDVENQVSQQNSPQPQ